MNNHSQTGATPKGRRTRGALVAAALELFAARGVHGTTVPDVARVAGVATGTMYRHFSSKEELVNAVFREAKTALLGALLDDFPVGAPPRAQFAAFWSRLAAFAEAQPLAFVFLELHHHTPYLDQANRALEVRALEGIAAMLHGVQARGVLQGERVETLMALVWGAFTGLFKAARAGYLTLDERTLSEAEEACWRLLARPAPDAPPRLLEETR